jgi:hypothetical protein
MRFQFRDASQHKASYRFAAHLDATIWFVNFENCTATRPDATLGARPPLDARSVDRKRDEIARRLTVMHQRHAEMLSRAALSADDLQATSVTLRGLERFWIGAADLGSVRKLSNLLLIELDMGL